MQGLGLGLNEKAIEAVKQTKYHGDGRFEVDLQFRLDHPAPWMWLAKHIV